MFNGAGPRQMGTESQPYYAMNTFFLSRSVVPNLGGHDSPRVTRITDVPLKGVGNQWGQQRLFLDCTAVIKRVFLSSWGWCQPSGECKDKYS